MENNSNHCVRNLRDNMWILINLLIKVVSSIASFIYINRPIILGVIGLIETLLAVLITVLAISFKNVSCCEKRSDDDEDVKAIEEGKKLENYLIQYSELVKGLKKIEGKNKEAAKLLIEIENARKNLITNN